VKDQYFADKRDFFKWDFLEDLLDGCPELKCFANITMLTPPDDSKEGNLKAYEVGHRREALYKFLQSCLIEGRQKVSGMRDYFQGKRFSYFPYRDSAETPYTFESRDDYFAKIPQEKLQQALVFFDPDIGLQAGRMIGGAVGNSNMRMPPLRFLHAEAILSEVKLCQFRAVSTRDIIESLRPGRPGALRARPDGTLLEGHHRIVVLRERGIDVDALPREVLPSDEGV
jgi:hypothetical protein